MYPLLAPGERVLFDRLAFRLAPPRRGDVVLVEAPGLPSPRLVKLVAGLPGEALRLARDRLWIDGRALRFRQPLVRAGRDHWTLGPHDYFLLSYAPEVGTDSRHFGPLPRAALRGRAIGVIAPASQARPIQPLELVLDDADPPSEPATPLRHL